MRALAKNLEPPVVSHGNNGGNKTLNSVGTPGESKDRISLRMVAGYVCHADKNEGKGLGKWRHVF